MLFLGSFYSCSVRCSLCCFFIGCLRHFPDLPGWPVAQAKEAPADKSGGEAGGDASASPTSTTTTARLRRWRSRQLQIERSRRAIRWAAAAKLVVAAALCSLAAKSILVVPDAMPCTHQPDFRRTAGTLYAGTHFITPLIERAQLYDVRDRVFSNFVRGGHARKAGGV